MEFLQNIRIVAKYEAKILRRSWFFRLFSLGALVIFTFLNLGMFSPIGNESWEVVSISSSVPLINLYLLNIGQAIVVIFLASDFLKRDKKVDTNEVLYTRPMSNLEYITGKTLGILRLFLGLNIIILSIGLLMNIISKSMSVDLMSYVSYLLIISVPTIIFSLGLAFMLMSLIRNQAITFLILLGIAALDMFWLNYRFGSIFDYMAFGLPVFKSGIIGFDNLSQIINQRLMYFFSGMALVLATTLLFKRLPQSKIHTSFAILFMFVFLAGTAVCTYKTYSFYKRNIDDKRNAIESNKRYENSSFVSLTNAYIDLQHNGNTIKASAKLRFTNDNKEDLNKYLFSLNPYLNVTSVTSNGKELNYRQTNNIIEIDPVNVLRAGQSDSAEIFYAGSIDESFCYPNYSDNMKTVPYRLAMVNVNKRQAFLTENYVLLTPESQWYPVPELNYYPSDPARIKVDFARYKLRVKAETGLTAVSQGDMKTKNGYSVFEPESPLTGITLAIGNYKSDTLKVDSVRYISFYFPGHDYYKKDLALIKDTLPLLVSGIMRDLETSFSTKYPFRSLSLVEVPVQFYSYPKMSTQTRAELQPSMVLLPEKLATLQNAGFQKRFTRQKKRMARSSQVLTDKELQVRLFNDFIRNTFISGQNYRYVNGVVLNEPVRYRLGPSFYFFKNNFYSSEYPVINAVFESHLQKQDVPQGEINSETMQLSENDKANLILKGISFKDMLAKNPSSDTIRAIITVKGDYLFNLLRSKAGIDEFKEWFSKYIDDHQFQRVDIETLNEEVKRRFGFEFYPYLSDWFNRKEQPGFLFTELQANEIVSGDRIRYLVTFVASNPESVAGIFNFSFRTGGSDQRSNEGQQAAVSGGGGNVAISMQGRGMEASDISKIVVLGPLEAKKIRIILDAQPRSISINTLFAKNIPGEITLPIEDIKKSKNKIPANESEELLPSIPQSSYPEELVVDNEDTGFVSGNPEIQSPLRKLLRISNKNGKSYEELNRYWAPEYWQPVVLSSYYGKYVRSSVYTRSGTDNRFITWRTKITDRGYYDIYCYIGKLSERISVGAGRTGTQAQPQDNDSQDKNFKDMHYKVFHDEGVEEITVDFENADPGWNLLGRYYLSTDSAKVELTNKSSGRMVIGDAVKWVEVK